MFLGLWEREFSLWGKEICRASICDVEYLCRCVVLGIDVCTGGCVWNDSIRWVLLGVMLFKLFYVVLFMGPSGLAPLRDLTVKW